ncbi:MAG: DUF4062 domain-containing protein [Longimicrobiales bacterium]
MATPYKAFVSSTFEDLKRHRAHVIQALRKSGIFVDPMEDWTAEADEPKRFSTDRLAGCHFCVLLVALRRGYVPEGESVSITQMEYQAAVDEGMDVLVYLLDEDAPWPHRFVEVDKDPEVRKWRDRLSARHGRVLFGLDPSTIEIAPAVTRWIEKQSRRSTKVGEDWIQLVSNLLELPAGSPNTWAVAAELLPHALDAVRAAYAHHSSAATLPETVARPVEVAQPQSIKPLLAGTREYLTASKDKYDRTCFVIIPYGKKQVGDRVIDFERIYQTIFKPGILDVVLPAPETGGLTPLRAVDVITSGIAMVELETVNYLEYSRFAVADLSGLNANVFYELGHRHRAHSSGTAMFRLHDSPVPFDPGHMRTVIYECETEAQVETARTLVTKVIQERLNIGETDSPVTLALKLEA